MLNSSHITQYEEQGFLVLPDFVSEKTCATLIAKAADWVAKLQAERGAAVFSTQKQSHHSNDYFLESGEKVSIFMEEGEEQVNKLGHALHDLDPLFDVFSRDPRMAEIATEIGMENPLLLQSMYIFKHPRVGGEVRVHQDSTFLYTNPPSVTGFWFAMQDATLENGCLWALPGGHRLGLKTKFVRGGAVGMTFEELDSTPLPTEGYVPLEVKAGTLVLLHGHLPHYSDKNVSKKPREAYAVHVIEGNADYPKDNWLQRSADFPLRGF